METHLPSYVGFDVARFDYHRVLAAADAFLLADPVTIVTARCPRSAGGAHDFYSEGDYWWQIQRDCHLSYVRRDGFSNPANFSYHRQLLTRLSIQVAALTAAWKITGDFKYARHATLHLAAWFVDPRFSMSPNLRFAQAIPGIATGRSIGIVDTIHLVEVSLAIRVLRSSSIQLKPILDQIVSWFDSYLDWLTKDTFARAEENRTNNLSTSWMLQVAAFSLLVGNDTLCNYAISKFQTVLLPMQMASNGSFPSELKRTKPYSYSLFNLELMVAFCQLLSTERSSLWHFTLSDGRGINKAIEFMFPYIRDKKSWPYPPDVMYFHEWPKRHNCFLFAGLAYKRDDYVSIWATLEPDTNVDEVIRNLFIRQPILWID